MPDSTGTVVTSVFGNVLPTRDTGAEIGSSATVGGASTAAEVTVTDAGAHYAGGNVETVLAELPSIFVQSATAVTVVSLTQAAYNLLSPPVANTLYIVVG